MHQPLDKRAAIRGDANVGIENGRWGEGVACEFLIMSGFDIIERNVRPCSWDKRYELDIIAYERKYDIIVFVEVKQHKKRSPLQMRLRSISRRKKRLLAIACRAWLRKTKWQGAYRFDVIEVYGEPEGRTPAEVDHIERVQLFENNGRYVNWVA